MKYIIATFAALAAACGTEQSLAPESGDMRVSVESGDMCVSVDCADTSDSDQSGNVIRLARETPVAPTSPYELVSIEVEPDTREGSAVITGFPIGGVVNGCAQQYRCVEPRTYDFVAEDSAAFRGFLDAVELETDDETCRSCDGEYTLTIGEVPITGCCPGRIVDAVPDLLQADAARPAFPSGASFEQLSYGVRGDLDEPFFMEGEFSEATVTRDSGGLILEGTVLRAESGLVAFGPRALSPDERSKLEELVAEFRAPLNVINHGVSSDCVNLRRIIVDATLAEESCSAYRYAEVFEAFNEFTEFLTSLSTVDR